MIDRYLGHGISHNLRKPDKVRPTDDLPRKSWTYCLASFRRARISGLAPTKPLSVYNTNHPSDNDSGASLLVTIPIIALGSILKLRNESQTNIKLFPDRLDFADKRHNCRGSRVDSERTENRFPN